MPENWSSSSIASLSNGKANAAKVDIPLFFTVISIAIMICLLLSIVNPCMMLNDSQFRSFEQIEPMKPLTVRATTNPLVDTGMYPTVSFLNGEFSWSESDFIVTGNYECRLGKITTDNTWAQGRIIPTAVILIWDGDVYVRTLSRAFSFSRPYSQGTLLSKIGVVPSIILLILIIGILITAILVVRDLYTEDENKK